MDAVKPYKFKMIRLNKCDSNYLEEDCKYYRDPEYSMIPKIGSVMCKQCRFFEKIDYDKRTIYCKKYMNKRKILKEIEKL
jgi:hypothetical protein